VKRYVILEDDEGSLRELVEMSSTRQRTSPREEVSAPKEQGLKALVRGLKDEAEMEAIADALEKTRWCRKDAAKMLGSATRRYSTKCGNSTWIRLAAGDPRRQWQRIPHPSRRAKRLTKVRAKSSFTSHCWKRSFVQQMLRGIVCGTLGTDYGHHKRFGSKGSSG